MRGHNEIFLLGAWARQPELRHTQSGLAIFEGTIAGEEEIIGADGQPKRLPFYHKVTLMGKPAEWQAEKNQSAGDAVAVFGAVEYSSWDDKDGGGKRSALNVKARRIEAVETSAERTQDAGGGQRLSGGENHVLLAGNLTADPETKETPGGKVTNLRLAVNETWTDKSGNKQEKTHWIDVAAWRELSDAAAGLSKGAPVLVRGRLSNESWTDKDGNKRSTQRVEATSLSRLNSDGAAGPAQPKGNMPL